jgi:hypothetical protein
MRVVRKPSKSLDVQQPCQKDTAWRHDGHLSRAGASHLHESTPDRHAFEDAKRRGHDLADRSPARRSGQGRRRVTAESS